MTEIGGSRPRSRPPGTSYHQQLARLILAGLLLFLAAAPSAAQRVVSPSGEIQLFLREGKVIEFDTPLYSVFVADPEIADVMLQSPNAVYVFGRNVGETTVFLADESGKTVLGRTLPEKAVRYGAAALFAVFGLLLVAEGLGWFGGQ